jgi:L-lysine exporter family protein LysE/ArgO
MSLLSSAAAGTLLSAGLIVAIGPQNLHVLRTGLARQHVAPTVALCVAVDALLIAAALAGASLALRADTPAGRLLQALAVPLLLWMAWRALRDAVLPACMPAAAGAATATRRQALAQAAWVSLGNPAVWVETIWIVGAAGATLAAGERLAFGGGAMFSSAAWFCLLGYGARAFSRWLARPAVMRVLAWCSALLLAALALQIGAALCQRAVGEPQALFERNAADFETVHRMPTWPGRYPRPASSGAAAA